MKQLHIEATKIESAIESVMLEEVKKATSICPSKVAINLAGNKPDQWSKLMPKVRETAINLMKQGHIIITRKGKPVENNDFKGVYRLRSAGNNSKL